MIFHILGNLSTSKHILVILICNVGEAFTFSGICGLMSLRIHDWVLNASYILIKIYALQYTAVNCITLHCTAVHNSEV